MSSYSIDTARTDSTPIAGSSSAGGNNNKSRRSLFSSASPMVNIFKTSARRSGKKSNSISSRSNKRRKSRKPATEELAWDGTGSSSLGSVTSLISALDELAPVPESDADSKWESFHQSNHRDSQPRRPARSTSMQDVNAEQY